MVVLGISAYYHDSAVSLIKNGELVYAIEEERFTRKKHDNSFPIQALNKTLSDNKLKPFQISAIAYYEKPLLKFERILETLVSTYPFSLKPYMRSLPETLGGKLGIEDTIRKHTKYEGPVYFIPHHLSHAAAAFYTSPYKKAAIATIDGVGEYDTTALWYGDGNSITKLSSLVFPHSLGLLYSTITAFLGFRVNNDEYKMMGLAAYGNPKHVKKIQKLIDIKKDGSFQLDMRYFGYCDTFTMWKKPLEELLGSPRKPKDSILKRHKDIAASIQTVTENVYFSILNNLYTKTRSKNLCIGGGVGLNSLANGKLYNNTHFKNIHVFGPSGDSGASAGAALYTYHTLAKKPKRVPTTNLYLGTKHISNDIETVLKNKGLSYIKYSKTKLVNETAKLLSKGHMIGWFQEQMEFGPRALGHRSILAKPSPRSMKNKVNIIKRREQFRPFAGSVLQSHVHELFDVPKKNLHAPFMNFCFPVKKSWKKKLAAIVHVDGTCRIQTVNKKDNEVYYDLVREFYKQTGIPCLLNTSFNLSHEPIVETPEQAVKDFMDTPLTALVIDDYLVTKS